MNHTQKIKQIKEELQDEGYTCRKNSFPVFLEDEGRFSLLDLACFKKDSVPIGIEVESKNTQQQRNLKGLKEFQRVHKAKVCQIFADDDLSKCDF